MSGDWRAGTVHEISSSAGEVFLEGRLDAEQHHGKRDHPVLRVGGCIQSSGLGGVFRAQGWGMFSELPMKTLYQAVSNRVISGH